MRISSPSFSVFKDVGTCFSSCTVASVDLDAASESAARLLVVELVSPDFMGLLLVVEVTDDSDAMDSILNKQGSAPLAESRLQCLGAT